MEREQMDREVRRYVMRAADTLDRIAGSLERIADSLEAGQPLLERHTKATEDLAVMAEADPLRAVDRLLAMGEDPTDPAGTLETMERRSELLEGLQESGSQARQDPPGGDEEVDPVSGGLTRKQLEEMSSQELEAELLRHMEPRKPEPGAVAAARQRAAERAGSSRRDPIMDRDDDSELPEHERWRLG